MGRGLGCAWLSLALAACADPGEKSVAACEDYVATQECGDFDFASSFPCASYAEETCNLSDWFDCLAENTTCDDPALGPVTDSGACAKFQCGSEGE